MRGGRGKRAPRGRSAAAPGGAPDPEGPSAPGVCAPGGGAWEPPALERRREHGGRAALAGRAAGGIPSPLLPSLLPPALTSRLSPSFLPPPLLAGRRRRALPFPVGALPGRFPGCGSRRGPAEPWGACHAGPALGS